ncbi:aromatic amino acid lyase [Shewanella sp. KX20019]|nr:aromatic amino acid lyase [Shewanella sp. KX20019]
MSLDHLNCEKVQDPYSLRCQPQVLGASGLVLEVLTVLHES